jgi:hypothetical protein
LHREALQSTPGAGLWSWGDLLAAAARLAGRRRLGSLAPSAAGLAGRRRPGRLVQGCHRQRERAGPAWGELTGANPVDRGKPGSKYHLLIDATGIPLAVGLSAANTHDSQLLQPMVDAVPAVIGPRGRPGGRAGARPSCMPIRAMTSRPADGCSVAAGSARGSRAVGWNPAPGWAATAGRSSGRWPGCWPTGA